MQGRGKTALITGASGGIGQELARVFAANGFNLVLVARSQEKLRALGNSLVKEYKVRADVIAADLAGPESPAKIMHQLDSRPLVVDVLVNNAGLGAYGEFKDSELARQLETIQVNIAALTELTRRLLPSMAKQGWGRILNVASTAAFMPGPLMAVYFATKAYVLSFSEALGAELKGSGVSVTVLCPGATATAFQSNAGMDGVFHNTKMMDAATVAQEGYAALMRGQAVYIPGLVNRLQALAPRFLPRGLVPGVVRRVWERNH